MSGTRWGVEYWGQSHWGWNDFERQYQPVSPFETQTDDALSVRAINDFIDGINNAKAYVFNHKLRSDVFFPALQSPNASAAAQVVRVFAPVFIPYGYEQLSFWAGHQRSAGSGSTAWDIYISSRPYRGAAVFDSAGFIGYTSAASFNTLSGAHAVTTELIAALPPNMYSREYFLTVVAQNSDASTRSKLTTLDIKPKLTI